MKEIISHSSWMSDIPDDARVTTLSIPGTHDSCSVDGLLGFGKTQNLDLADQLDAGIRFVDIRLAHYRDNLFVHHDVVHMGKCYADVLNTCTDFLRQHPSETIFLSVKNEGRLDSTLGRLAPSQIFGKSRGDRKNWVIRSKSFEHAFQARTWQYVDDESLFYNLAVPGPPGGRATANPALTSETTFEEIRGKIVLLRRFEGGQQVGSDFTYWPENRRFRTTKGLIYAVEDHYLDPGEDAKYNYVVTHMEEARERAPKDLYITFTSAVSLRGRGYAKLINPRLSDYLAGSPPGRVGIIAMDYFEEPKELVSSVIKMNSAIGGTVGQRARRVSHGQPPGG
jgi:1-phosphatidylinositol phosphodiesterase